MCAGLRTGGAGLLRAPCPCVERCLFTRAAGRAAGRPSVQSAVAVPAGLVFGRVGAGVVLVLL